MKHLDCQSLIERMEEAVQRAEALRLEEYLLYAKDYPRRFLMNLLDGIARGIGFSVGFSILGALLIAFLRNAAMANLPVIGRFLADLVRIVENYL